MSTNPFAAPTPGAPGPDPAAQQPVSPASQQHSGARLPSRLPDKGHTTPIGFGRLVSVELRKQLDTRAGKWLMGITLGLIILISALVAWSNRDHVSFYDLIGAAVVPMNYLVPILGIMAVTSEWSQRTGLVTFTLEPRRARVALAKLVSAAILALVATVMAFVSAALFTAIAGAIGSGSPNWHLEANGYWTIPLGMMLEAAMGVAFGLMLQNTPAAICAFLFIPIAVSMLSLVSWARKAMEWIDTSRAYQPLWDGTVHGSQWGKAAVATVLWLVVPMVIGFVRLNKREVKSA